MKRSRASSCRLDTTLEGLTGLKMGCIEGLYVEDEHRASGVALKLLRAAESWAKERGCLAFESDRDDRVIVHARYTGALPDKSFKAEPVSRVGCVRR